MGLIQRTSESDIDLRKIYKYIAVDNTSAAERLLLRIKKDLAMLSDMPGGGAPRPDLGMEVRTWPVPSTCCCIDRSTTASNYCGLFMECAKSGGCSGDAKVKPSQRLSSPRYQLQSTVRNEAIIRPQRQRPEIRAVADGEAEGDGDLQLLRQAAEGFLHAITW